MSSNYPPNLDPEPETQHTRDQIVIRGNDLVQAMWGLRNDNLITVYRTCSKEEAWNTVKTLVAGGELRLDLRQMAPLHDQVVQQVGNNETWVEKAEVDPRLLVLQRLGLQNNAPVKQREVVEFSYAPTQLNLDGVRIVVQINIKFTAEGSGLSFEGKGVVVQIGTPLAAVVLDV